MSWSLAPPNAVDVPLFGVRIAGWRGQYRNTFLGFFCHHYSRCLRSCPSIRTFRYILCICLNFLLYRIDLCRSICEHNHHMKSLAIALMEMRSWLFTHFFPFSLDIKFIWGDSAGLSSSHWIQSTSSKQFLAGESQPSPLGLVLRWQSCLGWWERSHGSRIQTSFASRPWIFQASCRHSRLFKQLGRYASYGSLVVKSEAFHSCFFEPKEEKFKFQRVAPTHPIAVVSMGLAHPCLARKESSWDSTPLVQVVLTLFNRHEKRRLKYYGEKKTQKHCKTWDERPKIKKNVRPSTRAGPCSWRCFLRILPR